MQIVINISEEDYISLKDTLEYAKNHDNAIDNAIVAIANGTVLPKGHGELKDMSEVHKTLDKYYYQNELYTLRMIEATIKNKVSVVLEADKEIVNARNSD